VVGSIETIRTVLNAATAQKMYGKKYAWYAITKVSKIHCMQVFTEYVYRASFLL